MGIIRGRVPKTAREEALHDWVQRATREQGPFRKCACGGWVRWDNPTVHAEVLTLAELIEKYGDPKHDECQKKKDGTQS